NHIANRRECVLPLRDSPAGELYRSIRRPRRFQCGFAQTQRSVHSLCGWIRGQIGESRLDVTVKPDFSQVETDDPQVTVNKRFQVYFPEKRPFFIEDAGYFSTPIDLFFTRNIVDPEFGARLSGKVGRWSFGELEMDDRAPGELLSPTDPLYGDHA